MAADGELGPAASGSGSGGDSDGDGGSSSSRAFQDGTGPQTQGGQAQSEQQQGEQQQGEQQQGAQQQAERQQHQPSQQQQLKLDTSAVGLGLSVGAKRPDGGAHNQSRGNGPADGGGDDGLPRLTVDTAGDAGSSDIHQVGQSKRDWSQNDMRARDSSGGSMSSALHFRPPFLSRRSFEVVYGGSKDSNGYSPNNHRGLASPPSSTLSSPALSAMIGDVTPLPSPLSPRQGSGSFSDAPMAALGGKPPASELRQPAAVANESSRLLADHQQSPRKRKVYPPLAPTSQPPAQTKQDQRSLSDYVPEPLYNVRPRNVTSPEDGQQRLDDQQRLDKGTSPTKLHREDYRVKQIKYGPKNVLSSAVPVAENEEVIHVHDKTFGCTLSYRPLAKVGHGAFSKVFLATGVEDATQLVAIKIVKQAQIAAEARMEVSIQREVQMLRQIKHPNLPQLLAYDSGAGGEDAPAVLAMTYCPGGDLFELASKRRDCLVPSAIQHIFAQLVDATAYLHRNLIVHRDIKLENVLLNRPAEEVVDLVTKGSDNIPSLVVLTDLGLAKQIPAPPASPMLTHMCGSIDYVAPEILLGQSYDGRAADAWALGALLYAVMEGRLPFDPLPQRRGPGNTSVHGNAAAPNGRMVSAGATLNSASLTGVKHRIARCDWLWCEYGDEYGDWRDAAPELYNDSLKRNPVTMAGARPIVENLLKKVSRGRWNVQDNVIANDWVQEALKMRGE